MDVAECPRRVWTCQNVILAVRLLASLARGTENALDTLSRLLGLEQRIFADLHHSFNIIKTK